MSYQFQPPGSPPPPVTAASVVPPPPGPNGKPKRLLLGLGAIVLVGGLAAGGVFYGKSTSAVNDTVSRFARAPIGCTTTLEFDRTDTFTLFVETKGTAGNAGGDCKGNGASFDHQGAKVPTVKLSLTDANDQSTPLTAFTGYSYDTDSFRGSAVEQVKITAPGTYRLTVTSDASDVGVSVGGDPEVDQSRLQLIAIASAIGGVVLGLGLMVLGRPKRPTPTAPVAASPYTPYVYTPPAQAAPTPVWQPAPPASPVPPPPAAPGQGWGAPQP
jgi:hypothetical protein